MARSGTNGIATRHRFAGRCVNTIVLTRPMRFAMRTATRYESALRMPVAKKSVPAARERQVEALVQPQREQRLHDEAAAEASRLKSAASVNTARRDGRERRDRLGVRDSSAARQARGRRAQPRRRAARRATNIACSAGAHAATRSTRRAAPARRRPASRPRRPACRQARSARTPPCGAGRRRRATSTACSSGRNTLTSPLDGLSVPTTAITSSGQKLR